MFYASLLTVNFKNGLRTFEAETVKIVNYLKIIQPQPKNCTFSQKIVHIISTFVLLY